MRSFALLVLAALLSGCPAGDEARGGAVDPAPSPGPIAEPPQARDVSCGVSGSDPQSIGTATLETDGTIVLALRTMGPGPVGEAVLRYPPTRPEYAEVWRHLGGLELGVAKPVPPWPED